MEVQFAVERVDDGHDPTTPRGIFDAGAQIRVLLGRDFRVKFVQIRCANKYPRSGRAIPMMLRQVQNHPTAGNL